MSSISNRFMTGLVLITALLLAPQSLMAQTSSAATNDWSNVTALDPSSRLIVRLKNGNSIEGKLGAVTDVMLSLSAKNKVVEVNRDEVRSVHQVKKKSATKSTLIGLGVGAGAGAAAGAIIGNDRHGFDKIEKVATGVIAVLSAGVGALTGYLIGRNRTKRVLIYESRQP